MNAHLRSRRRALQIVYRRYLRADSEWIEACAALKLWFPETRDPKTALIGNPGSRIRRLHDRRERAILQLNTAVQKLNVARRRLDHRRSVQPEIVLLVNAP